MKYKSLLYTVREKMKNIKKMIRETLKKTKINDSNYSRLIEIDPSKKSNKRKYVDLEKIMWCHIK